MSFAVDASFSAPPSRWLLALEGRALPELALFGAALPLLARAPRGDGHPVIVIPGLMASDLAMRPLAAFLRGRGYAAQGWGLGRNLGPLPGVEDRMIARIETLRRTHGRKVSLIGWSLGGIYARQIAKRLPDDIRCVISLGSPFKGSPRATNAWKVYEYVSGFRSEDRDQHMGGAIDTPPPVPFTAIYSRSDGVCSWRVCRENEGLMTENIEVEGSHCGLPHNPAAAFAIADRLALPEGSWSKFDRASGWRPWLFRDPDR
ncbi:alpha/beta hydrolase [Terrarubrum flagellatum]|uniref:esterase/lipase family protein n=1 Tax=Terrirubrum flagellatum TaxID=2895980 RepID=UPI003144F250